MPRTEEQTEEPGDQLDAAELILNDYKVRSAMDAEMKAYLDRLHAEGEEQRKEVYAHVKAVWLGKVLPLTNIKKKLTTNDVQCILDKEFDDLLGSFRFFVESVVHHGHIFHQLESLASQDIFVVGPIYYQLLGAPVLGILG